MMRRKQRQERRRRRDTNGEKYPTDSIDENLVKEKLEYIYNTAVPEKHERFPEENDTHGNEEFKLRLMPINACRFSQLVTQLVWRMNEGNGVAFYYVGVEDDGVIRGLEADQMKASIETIARMCADIEATFTVTNVYAGKPSASYIAVKLRVDKLLSDGRVATSDVRVTVIGAANSGKSTLISVLTRGVLDNGKGSARMQVFQHAHEVEDGRTSSISHQVFNSNTNKALITLTDSAGHPRYLKTTASGLSGNIPDYAMLLIDPTVGIDSMTLVHLHLAIALRLSLFVVISKQDSATADQVSRVINQLKVAVKPPFRVSQVADNNNIEELCCESTVIPVFTASSVTGSNIPLLRKFITKLSPRLEWEKKAEEQTLFYVDKCHDTLHTDSTLFVVTGMVKRGYITTGTRLLLGPCGNTGKFCSVTVDSIEIQHSKCKSIGAGQVGGLCIRAENGLSIRKGTMLVHPSVEPRATRRFDAEIQVLRFDDLDDFPSKNVQAVVHAGPIRQIARVLSVFNNKAALRGKTTGVVSCRFEFLYSPEYVHSGLPLVIRGGGGIAGGVNAAGRVVRAVYSV